MGLILPYHKRDLDSDLNEQAKSQSNSGKIRVKSLLASILTVSRLVMIHDRGPVIHPWRSNAHGELQWRFSALLDYGLNGPYYFDQVCQTRRLADLRPNMGADFYDDVLLLLLFLLMFVKMFLTSRRC